MDTGNLKNIVFLKDLPSNIVEEAIVFLKENKKIEKLELVEKKQNKVTQVEKNNGKDYIIKEAQMLIAEYISKLENKNKKETQSYQNLKKKCKRLKIINEILLGGLFISLIINFAM